MAFISLTTAIASRYITNLGGRGKSKERWEFSLIYTSSKNIDIKLVSCFRERPFYNLYLFMYIRMDTNVMRLGGIE